MGRIARIAFEGPEGCLDLDELQIELPKLRRIGLGEIGAQQIAPFPDSREQTPKRTVADARLWPKAALPYEVEPTWVRTLSVRSSLNCYTLAKNQESSSLSAQHSNFRHFTSRAMIRRNSFPAALPLHRVA